MQVKQLIGWGYNISTRMNISDGWNSKENVTLLMVAAYGGATETFEYVLNMNRFGDEECDSNNWRAYHYAAASVIDNNRTYLLLPSKFPDIILDDEMVRTLLLRNLLFHTKVHFSNAIWDDGKPLELRSFLITDRKIRWTGYRFGRSVNRTIFRIKAQDLDVKSRKMFTHRFILPCDPTTNKLSMVINSFESSAAVFEESQIFERSLSVSNMIELDSCVYADCDFDLNLAFNTNTSKCQRCKESIMFDLCHFHN